MNKLAKALLSSTALTALACAPAVAGSAPAFHFRALHGGRVVNKTKMPNHGAAHITYTFGIYTDIPSSDFRKTVKLTSTFVTFSGMCSLGSAVKMKAPKKSEYGKIGIVAETYTNRCAFPVVVYGNTYKLTDSAGEGHTDHFVSSRIYKFANGSTKYKGTLNLDVSVDIGQ